MDSTQQKHFLTIHISNCLYNGTTFLSDSDRIILSDELSMAFRQIDGIEFRGIGYTTVRGAHNSLNIGIGGGFYNNKENINRTEMFALRARIRKSLLGFKSLTFSEVRIEITKEVGARFDE